MTLPDFSHLKAFDQKPDVEVPFQLTQLPGAPTIWFLPGTGANKPFNNEALRRANQRARAGRRSRMVTDATLKASLDEDRELLAQFCAKRWDVCDRANQPVDFTAENCLEFFRALPDWMFEEIRNFVTDPGNFVDGGEALGEA